MVILDTNAIGCISHNKTVSEIITICTIKTLVPSFLLLSHVTERFYHWKEWKANWNLINLIIWYCLSPLLSSFIYLNIYTSRKQCCHNVTDILRFFCWYSSTLHHTIPSSLHFFNEENLIFLFRWVMSDND